MIRSSRQNNFSFLIFTFEFRDMQPGLERLQIQSRGSIDIAEVNLRLAVQHKEPVITCYIPTTPPWTCENKESLNTLLALTHFWHLYPRLAEYKLSHFQGEVINNRPISCIVLLHIKQVMSHAKIPPVINTQYHMIDWQGNQWGHHAFHYGYIVCWISNRIQWVVSTLRKLSGGKIRDWTWSKACNTSVATNLFMNWGKGSVFNSYSASRNN